MDNCQIKINDIFISYMYIRPGILDQTSVLCFSTGFRMAIQMSSVLLGSLLLQYVHDWGAPLCVVIEPSEVEPFLYPMWYKSVDKFLESGKRCELTWNTFELTWNTCRSCTLI
jgi:hypothetical protein